MRLDRELIALAKSHSLEEIAAQLRRVPVSLSIFGNPVLVGSAAGASRVVLLTQIDAVIEVESDCPNEWARYCDLAYQLVQRKQPTEISQEAASRQHLAENGESIQQKTAEMARMACFTVSWLADQQSRWPSFILRETRSLEIMLRERLRSAL
jgi:hypothetical protein